jgi:outer membrane murein-binding lipoprotein Lpp
MGEVAELTVQVQRLTQQLEAARAEAAAAAASGAAGEYVGRL